MNRNVKLFNSNMRVFRVQFQVEAQTIYGQQAYICGNIPQLGNWQPDKALKLQTTSTSYPWWKSKDELVALKQYTQLEFKLIIVNKSKNYIRWETINRNREFVVQFHVCAIFSENIQNLELKIIQGLEKNVRKTSKVMEDIDSDLSNKDQWEQRNKTNDQIFFYHQTLASFRKIVQSHQESETQFHKRSSLEPHRLQYPLKKLLLNCKLTPYFLFIEEQDQQSQKMQRKSTANSQDNEKCLQKSNCITIGFKNQQIKDCLKQIGIWIKRQQIEFSIVALHIFLKARNTALLEQILQENLHCKIIIHISNEYPRQILNLSKKSSMIIVQDIQTLKKLIADFSIGGFHSKLIGKGLFNVYHPNYQETLIYCPQQKNYLESENNKDNSYVKSINQILLTKNHYTQNQLQFQGLMTDFASRTSNKVIILSVNNLRELSQKLRNKIVELSFKKNHKIYIIHKQSLNGINLHTSKSNNLIILNSEGELYSSCELKGSLYKSIDLSTHQLKDIYKKMVQNINDQIHCKVNYPFDHTLVCHFSPDQFGNKVKLFFHQMIDNHNRKSLHKLVIFQKGEYDIEIRPLWLITSFYIQTILNIQFNGDKKQRMIIIGIDINSNEGILNLIERSLQNYSSYDFQYFGFVSNQSCNCIMNTTRPVLNQQNFEKLLNSLAQKQKNN